MAAQRQRPVDARADHRSDAAIMLQVVIVMAMPGMMRGLMVVLIVRRRSPKPAPHVGGLGRRIVEAAGEQAPRRPPALCAVEHCGAPG